MNDVTAKPKHKLYYGWFVVIGCCICYCAYASLAWVNTICFPLIQKDLGWTAKDLGLLLAISSWGSILWMSTGGWIVNRIGNRRAILIFYFVAASSVLMYTTVKSIWQMIIFYPILCSFATATGNSIGVVSLPRKWFMKRAAVATGLIGGVWAFVSSVVFPGMSSLGAKIGWRNAIFILVPIFAVIGIVSCLFLIRDTPEQKGLRVDGLSDEELKKIKAGRTGEAKEEANMTLRQALRTPQLWMLGIAYGLTLDDLGVMQGQSTIMATTYGIPIALAGMAMSALMIPAIFSRIGVGFLGDRYGRRRVLIYSSAGAALINIGGCFMVHNQTTLLVFLTSLGLFMMAGMTLTAPICGDLFGRKNIATIWGFCAGLAALISGVVSYTAGVIRTATGTYNLVYLILGAGFIIQVVIVLCLRPTKVERDNLQGQRL